MRKIIKAFFYNSKGCFKVVYFWATIFCILSVTMLALKLFTPNGHQVISDKLILGMLGFVMGWIGLYNYQKKK